MSTTLILLWVSIAIQATGLLGLLAHLFVTQLIVFAVLFMVMLLRTRTLVRRWSTYLSVPCPQLVGELGIVVTWLTWGKPA